MQWLRYSSLSLALALSGCLVGNGESVTEDVDPGSFDAVRNDGPIDVLITVDEEHRPLQVTCDSNLMEEIEIRVDRGTLVVRARDGAWINPGTDCVVEGSTPTLRAAENEGSGDLTIQGTTSAGLELVGCHGSGSLHIDAEIDVDSLRVEADGSGSIDIAAIDSRELSVSVEGSGSVGLLSGRATLFDASVEGSGSLHAFCLATRDTDLAVSGSGSAEVFVVESIDVSVSGSGSAHIAGEPDTREQSVSGSGSVLYGEP